MVYSEYFNNFWLRYGDANTSKGSKRSAWKAWEKIGKAWCKEQSYLEYKEVEFAREVARGYDSILRNRDAARKAKKFVPVLPHLSTFLNRYDFEVEHEVSTGELKRQTADYVCAQCGSDRNISGNPNAGIACLCSRCYQKEWGKTDRQAKIDYLERHGIGVENGWSVGSCIRAIERIMPGFTSRWSGASNNTDDF